MRTTRKSGDSSHSSPKDSLRAYLQALAADPPIDPLEMERDFGEEFGWTSSSPSDPDLIERSARAVDEMCALYSAELGRASMARFRPKLEAALLWAREKYRPTRGPFEHLASSVGRRTMAEFRVECRGLLR
jgi:hypothetical protein